jgi:hypothetical protein
MAVRTLWAGVLGGLIAMGSVNAYAQDVQKKPAPEQKKPAPPIRPRAPAPAPDEEEAPPPPPPAEGPIPEDEQVLEVAPEAPPPAETEAVAEEEIPSEPLVQHPAEEPPPPPMGPPQGPPPYWGPPPGYGYGYGYPEMPEEIDDEGQEPPPGYIRQTRVRKGLVIGGAITFGTTWLLSAVTAGMVMDNGSEEDGERFAPLFAPVVGPFIAMATTNSEGVGTLVLAIDGIAQAGGLAMLIAGCAAQKSVFVRTGPMGEQMTITPMIGKDANGFALTGSF